MEEATIGIIREPTKDELSGESGFLPIITPKGIVRTPSDKFHEKVENTAMEVTNKKKPFCRACAYKDYKEMIKKAESESGYADFNKLGIKLPKLDEYSKDDRFEVVKKGEEMNPGRWKGDKTTFDKWTQYRCKVRGHLITIFD